MKAFLKTLIGGALGIGALYVVGKVCYEAGKDVAEVERQLENSQTEKEATATVHVEQLQMDLDSIDRSGDSGATVNGDANEAVTGEFGKPKMVDRFVNKVKNAKMFLKVKKAFDKGDRGKGILGSLLTNPDGAKIEAYVRDGGVHINVRPRAA